MARPPRPRSGGVPRCGARQIDGNDNDQNSVAVALARSIVMAPDNRARKARLRGRRISLKSATLSRPQASYSSRTRRRPCSTEDLDAESPSG